MKAARPEGLSAERRGAEARRPARRLPGAVCRAARKGTRIFSVNRCKQAGQKFKGEWKREKRGNRRLNNFLRSVYIKGGIKVGLWSRKYFCYCFCLSDDRSKFRTERGNHLAS